MEPSTIQVPDSVKVTSPTPVAPVAPAPAPDVTPVQTAPVTPPAEGNNNSGGGDSITEFFKSINWLEAGIAILGIVGLYYTVYYYRYKLKEDKVANSDTQRQIDEIKMNVQSAMKGKYQAL